MMERERKKKKRRTRKDSTERFWNMEKMREGLQPVETPIHMTQSETVK